MSLDRHREVARIWDWLPAFRAAAEYESLQRAGQALALSPSALSRSIKLLEETLGQPLFTRSPTGLSLTEHGHRLLVATREAMRRVHDGLVAPTELTLRAGAVGPVLPRLLCDAAIDALPGWALHFAEVSFDRAAERLRCGELDVVLSHLPLALVDLSCQAAAGLQFVVGLPPGAVRERLVCLEPPSLSIPGATSTAASLDQLVQLAQRLGAAACLPLATLPAGWQVLEAGPLAPVFVVTRAYAAPPPFITGLFASLEARLSATPQAARV